jgi:D-3-phosphoglycerate dehydrogenase / 2-oxoglutarate reductase
MGRVLLTFPPQARKNYYSDRAVAGLGMLAEVRLNDRDGPYDHAGLIEAARDCDVIVSDRQTAGRAELFRSLPDLVAFTRCAVDIRNIDVAAASECGVLVTHASAGFIVSVAEWVIGAMIDLGRHITASAESYHAGGAPAVRTGSELKGSTMGVIGYGQIGRYLCDLGLALGMRVVVVSPYTKVTNPALLQIELPQLLAEADYVVCLAAATRETENLMNAQAFARMKPSAFFINASRGELVDELALAQALDTGRIAGSALDVGRAPDQMPTPSLARHPKVIATPHIGGLTPQAAEHQALETVGQVAEILKGRAPVGAVNADAATRLARLARRTSG